MTRKRFHVSRTPLAATLALGLALASLVALAAGEARAQADIWKAVKIRHVEVRDNVSMLVGRGGNMAISTGPDGVFLVDDQYAELSEKIRAAIAERSELPVRFLVNTHWHGDHSGGNADFAKLGSVIVAHENVRARMAVEQRLKSAGMERTIPASPPEALPIVTFSDEVTFHWNGDTIRVMHAPNAHTDTDSIIHFVEDDVFHMGDLFFNKLYPFVDHSTGGSVRGMIDAADRVLAACGTDTKIIPGHGELATTADLRAYRDMLATIYDRVARLVAAGQSLEQVRSADPSAEWNEIWGAGFMNAETFVGLLYNDCKRAERATE